MAVFFFFVLALFETVDEAPLDLKNLRRLDTPELFFKLRVKK